ncbi:MAG: winged helix-turn-helix transcriptional regulator [Nitrospinota bacterium]
MDNPGQMESQELRDLQILTEIEQGGSITQRSLATKLGVALGLTNLYLKRLAKKGHIKVTTLPRNRVKYLLTPRGIAEKTRLTYEYMSYSLRQYLRARQMLQKSLGSMVNAGHRRIAFYGTDEAAEVAFICLKEIGLEPSAVFDDEDGGHFLGMPVRPLRTLVQEEFDRIVVTSLGAKRVTRSRMDTLTARGVPEEKVVSLRL